MDARRPGIVSISTLLTIVSAVSAMPMASGRVSAPSGIGMPGVVVTALRSGAAHVAVSDPEGTYTFADLPPAEYEISFFIEAFRSEPMRVSVGFADLCLPDQWLELDQPADLVVCICDPVIDPVQARRKGRMTKRTIQVFDEEGVPIEGANLEIPGIGSFQAASGSEGRIQYESIEGAESSLKVVAAGFRNLESEYLLLRGGCQSDAS